MRERQVDPRRQLEAIILAGGQGSRLRDAVSVLPKPMAPVAGKPFLAYQLGWLAHQGVSRVVLSVGYRYDAIVSYFGNSYENVRLSYAIEDRPLGTGGGFLHALEQVHSSNVLLLNGDTYFSVDVGCMWDAHNETNAVVTIALRSLNNRERYGRVEMDAARHITRFSATGGSGPGLVNGGVYIISVAGFLLHAPSKIFSLETDFLECQVARLKMIGVPFNAFFIDIGTPDDYQRAQELLPQQI